MPQEDTTIRRKIRLIEKHTNELRKMTPTDAELADTVGHVRAIEISLGDARRRWEMIVAEMEPKRTWDPQRRVNTNERAGAPEVEGKDFSLVKQFKNVYTFNTPAILTGIAASDEAMTPTDALMEAIGMEAATLKWGVTKLQKMADLIGFPLTISVEEVHDHDGTDEPMIGKVRVPNGVKRIALKREE